jgi:hypothetical protein
VEQHWLGVQIYSRRAKNVEGESMEKLQSISLHIMNAVIWYFLNGKVMTPAYLKEAYNDLVLGKVYRSATKRHQIGSFDGILHAYKVSERKYVLLVRWSDYMLDGFAGASWMTEATIISIVVFTELPTKNTIEIIKEFNLSFTSKDMDSVIKHVEDNLIPELICSENSEEINGKAVLDKEMDSIVKMVKEYFHIEGKAYKKESNGGIYVSGSSYRKKGGYRYSDVYIHEIVCGDKILIQYQRISDNSHGWDFLKLRSVFQIVDGRLEKVKDISYKDIPNAEIIGDWTHFSK